MRVCAPHLGLCPGSDLGGEVSERALLTRLAGLGDTLRLLAPPEADFGPLAPGWRLERWGRRRARRFWRSNAAARRALEEAYRREPFDIVHVHSGLHFGRGATAARRRLDAAFPIVVHHHHLEGALVCRRLEISACRAADAVVVPSRFAAAALAQAGGPAGDGVAIIPRGVERPAAAPERAPAPDRGRRVILSIGRLVARKAPLLLVDAMAEIERALPGAARLRLLGDGALAGAVRRRAAALGVAEIVEVRGRSSEADKWREIAACAAFAVASRLEGFGLAAAEAMAGGAPVVAPRCAAFPELIEDGVSGLLVAPRDARALAAALLLLLRQPRRARDLGEAAARRARAEFSWDAAARRLHDLYAALCGARRSAPAADGRINAGSRARSAGGRTEANSQDREEFADGQKSTRS